MQSKAGEIHEGKVTGITNFGAFVKLENGETGMVHISEVAPVFVKDINAFLSVGQDVKVKVLSVGENNKISLSIKQASSGENDNTVKERKIAQKPLSAERPARPRTTAAPSGPLSFEDMMAKFKAVSDEKMSDLKRTGEKVRSTRRGNKS